MRVFLENDNVVCALHMKIGTDFFLVEQVIQNVPEFEIHSLGEVFSQSSFLGDPADVHGQAVGELFQSLYFDALQRTEIYSSDYS